MDDGVRLERHGGLDPRRRRIGDRDAGEHVRGVDAVAECRCCCRKFDPRVDALGLACVRCDVDGNRVPVRDEIAHRIREVELALSIDGLQPVERGPEELRPEDVDRGVRLVDRELLRRSRRPPRRSTRGRRRRLERSGRSSGSRRGRTREPWRRPLTSDGWRRDPRGVRSSAAECRPRGSEPRRPRRPRPERYARHLPFRATAPESQR